MSYPLGSKVEKEKSSEKSRIIPTKIDDPCKLGNIFSSSKEEDVTVTTMQPKETETSLKIPSLKLDSLKEKLNLIEPEYSFICLLTEASALDQLKYVNRQPRFFIKPYECLSEVIKLVGQKLIIIVSQSLSKHFVPIIHDLIQVIYIYILHNYDNYYENGDNNYVNDKRYPKVHGSFIEQTLLLSKLNDDLQQLSNIPSSQPILTDYFQKNRNIDLYIISKQSFSLKALTSEEQDFVSFQLIIRAILESDSANPLNNLVTSLNLCRIFSNKCERKLLWETNDEFQEKYVPNNTINFYLADTLLKNELNTCFGSKNIQKICKLWFFIRDLLKHLPGGKKPITVYRRQYLRVDKLQILKNNIGSFMTFTRFFSMSTSNLHAIRRSGREHIGFLYRSRLKPVLFQLEISNGNTSTRFSMIKQSYEELIFLFAAGSVFRIESVEELNNQVWCCKLCINSDDEHELTRMFQRYETEIGTSLTYLSLGVYLNEIGKEDIAVQYYETLLAVAADSRITSSIHNNLAIIYECRKDLTSARYHWNLVSKTQKVDTLKTSTPLLQETLDVVMADPVPDTSPIINYYNLACVYRLTGRFDEALEECEKALKLKTTVSYSANIALIHSAMGSVYFSQKNHEDALKSFKMALDIALIHLPATDPLIDRYLNNIRLLDNLINEK